MATTKKAITVPKKKGTGLATIDAELANEVALLKGAIAAPSGNRIKADPSGDFILPDGLNLGNSFEVVVLSFISANRFYSGPNLISPPDCFSFGTTLNDMVPDDDAPNKQHGDCRSCPMNQFGSSSNGSGKACKNTRELAVLLIDPEAPDAHNEPDAPIYTMSLPPTAIKSFDAGVGYVARTLNAPPIKAIFTVTGRNVGTYSQISFVNPVPNPDYAQHMMRRDECADMLYRKPDYSAPAVSVKGKAGAAKRGNVTAAAPRRR